MSSSVPAAGRSRFSYLGRSRPKVEGQVEDDDTVIDEEDDEDEDEDEDEETKKKKKAKKKAEDKEDEDDDKKSDAHAARARERARVRAIMSSTAGQQFPTVALSVATGTSIPRHQAIRILRAMTKDLSPDAGSGSLRDRMAGLNQPDLGAGGGPETPAPGGRVMTVEACLRAAAKARGEIPI